MKYEFEIGDAKRTFVEETKRVVFTLEKKGNMIVLVINDYLVVRFEPGFPIKLIRGLGDVDFGIPIDDSGRIKVE